jgi:hypothetical protein
MPPPTIARLKSFVVFADILEYGGLGEDNACDDVKYDAGPAEEKQESFVAVICEGMCLVVPAHCQARGMYRLGCSRKDSSCSGSSGIDEL